MRVRPVTADDAREVARLCTDLGYPSTRADILSRAAGLPADHAVLVAERSGEVVGWIHVRASHLLVSAPRAEIAGLMVDAPAQRDGVGRTLVEAAEAWARDRGLDSILVRSNVVREGAHAFYEALGYERTKTSLNFTREL